MAVRVQLPPGNSGVDMADGTRYTAAGPGGHVTVSDRHAAAIRRRFGGDAGLLGASGATVLGTRLGRWCTACNRLWQAWSTSCPRCGAPTLLEADRPDPG